MNLTPLLVSTYRNMLQMQLGLLDKAELQFGAERAEVLLSARLAPDMWPLATQLRLSALQAQEGPMRLLGLSLEPLLNEGRNAGEQPGTLAEARGRIEQALAFLAELPGDALDRLSLPAARWS
jgi:hypothetical protein